ncbi:glycoside hydrolase family 61 protein [Chaetomium sp. MPI-CAGE-AT-0009]|nr:glycoside hydrolase family 61 protein [Chaetomium sp. MPI-CAGE-AT-0009]
MPPPLLTTLLTLLPLTPLIHAHSHLAHILINGQLYHGFDPRPNQPNSPSRVGWWTAATDDGFVTPANYTHPDIICHKSGASPAAHAPVRAGDRVHVQWNGWPVGHVGPVLSYLAGCAGLEGDEAGCTGVDKTALRWTKVDDSAPVLEFVEGAGVNGGVPGQRWASDVLIAANNSWQVAIPEGLRTGPYVLRNEVIALHYAAKEDGAQNYPLCVNLEDDPGVRLNVSAGLSSYVVPGPTVAVGATPVPYAEQTLSLFEAEGTPVVVVRGTETVPFSGRAAPTAAPTARGRYDRN